MPFERPTLSVLVGRVKADLRGRLSIAGPLLRRAMADVLGTVWAGAVHMLHGHLEWLGRQLIADTAEREFLLRQAALYGVTPIPASFASGTVTATGTNGSVIPINSILQLDTEITYRATSAATIALGVATVPVEAVTAGSASDVAAGVSLTFESPIVGVSATVVVDTGGISDGFDEESTEGLRARFILRLREPPEGGADHDYEGWALAVPGITRAWVYPTELGLGTVVVRFVLDAQTPTIFPDVPTVAAVQAALEAQRPITAEVTAVAPVALAVNFTIALLPDTAQTRVDVAAELADLLFRQGAPGDGAGRGTIKLSHIRTSIGEAADDYTLTVPSADVVPTVGQLPVMGTVTWV